MPAALANGIRRCKSKSVGTVDIWQETVRLRQQFAERIESLDETAWNSASWCEGWFVRDVLGHLVQNVERTYTSLTLDLLRGGFGPDRAMGKAAKRLRSSSVPELAERLRLAAERHLHLPGSTEAMGLADVLVHSADAFRPVGLGWMRPHPTRALRWTLCGSRAGSSSMRYLIGVADW